jgi:hypothetical protein
MQGIKVEAYAGYRSDQRPLRFTLGERTFEVMAIEDQWYSPACIYFRVLADDGNIYVLRHYEVEDRWALDAFRKAPGGIIP